MWLDCSRSGVVNRLADDVIFLLDGKIFFNGSLNTLLSEQDQYNLENAIANILKSSNKNQYA